MSESFFAKNVLFVRPRDNGLLYSLVLGLQTIPVEKNHALQSLAV